MFKKAIVALTLLGASSWAYAACSTHSYTIGGKFTTCTTCCFNGICNTTCT